MLMLVLMVVALFGRNVSEEHASKETSIEPRTNRRANNDEQLIKSKVV